MPRLMRVLLRDERGGPLAEFALVIGLMFVVGIFIFEMTRFSMRGAMAEYATHLAVRIAAVRPPICPGVPEFNERVNGSTARFGTMCSHASAPCAAAAQTCPGTAGNAVMDEIFATIQPLLPVGATPANLQFRYEPTGLGFLGGPYVPMTSVSLQNLQHQFILPIGQLFAPWGGAGGSGAVALGPLTATMPGEDSTSEPADERASFTALWGVSNDPCQRPQCPGDDQIGRARRADQPHVRRAGRRARRDAHRRPAQRQRRARRALERVDVLLVDIDANDERELRHLGEIIQRRGRTAILATARDLSAQGVRSLIRQGVDDFIPQPFELPDMQDAIATARAKLQQARAGRQSGQVITVTRAKGGMGASTLAAHLALALARSASARPREAGRAARSGPAVRRSVADARPQAERRDGGDHPRSGPPGRRSAARLDDAAQERPLRAARAERVRALDALPVAAVIKLIELARRVRFRGHRSAACCPRWLEAVLQQTSCLVGQLNVAAIRQTRRLLDFLKEEGHYELPVSVVLNRYVWRFSERGRLKQAIRALGQPIDHFVPDDARLALEAINRGTPLFELRRRAKLCRALRQVAAASITSMQQRAQAAGSAAQAA